MYTKDIAIEFALPNNCPNFEVLKLKTGLFKARMDVEQADRTMTVKLNHDDVKKVQDLIRAHITCDQIALRSMKINFMFQGE